VGDVLYAATQFRTRPIREEPRRKPATVLLVDPDPATLAAMEQALRDEGFVTATAFDGAGALAASHRVGALDVLVSCAHAVGLDAVELADTLRRHHPAMQVLYLTTVDDELFEDRLPVLGDDEVIEKPFSGGDLVEAVSSLLR
jgi:two-component system, cell cycle sensor histidine kinase and response regulator CckA